MLSLPPPLTLASSSSPLLCSGFTPSCMAHPDTYLNKVVVGSQEGRLQLWNFATGARLHEFPGWGAPVACLAPSPALDVMGVGLADGCAPAPCAAALRCAVQGAPACLPACLACTTPASSSIAHTCVRTLPLHPSAPVNPSAAGPLAPGRVSDAGQSDASGDSLTTPAPIGCYLIVPPAQPTPSITHPLHCIHSLPIAAPPLTPPICTPPALPRRHPTHPQNRRAVLHNLRFDETLMTFHNAAGAGTNADLFLTGSTAQAARLTAGGAVTCIAFRTGAGVPLMAAGGGAGVITVWNLEERRLHTLVRDAHDAPLATLHFFPGALP